MDKEKSALLDNYFEVKKQMDKVCDEVYPLIKEICEVCTRLTDGDRIESIEIEEDEPLMFDEPEVCVSVENWNCGPDTYYFPKRYLSMTIDEIKADVEKCKKEEEDKEQKRRLEKERREYERLKKKFDKKDGEQ